MIFELEVETEMRPHKQIPAIDVIISIKKGIEETIRFSVEKSILGDACKLIEKAKRFTGKCIPPLKEEKVSEKKQLTVSLTLMFQSFEQRKMFLEAIQ